MFRNPLLPAIALVLAVALPASAADDCSWLDDGATRYLTGNCTTDATLFIPDGVTLDGQGFVITAVDPDNGHFIGPVLTNAGTEAHVTNLEIQGAFTENTCDGGADRLRGIMFEGASGSITHVTVIGINQGPSGCQEGNAIEVRNAPFDGTHPNTQEVTIEHATILDYQKTGLVCNGDVDCTVRLNDIGASATQDDLAANSIQFGYGAAGEIWNNAIDGNQWKGTSDWAATAILIYLADAGLDVSNNRIGGNSDIGIYVLADDGLFTNNKVFDEGADHPNSGYDYGIGNWGAGNVLQLNKVRGFEIPIDGEEGDHNIVIPSPGN